MGFLWMMLTLAGSPAMGTNDACEDSCAHERDACIDFARIPDSDGPSREERLEKCEAEHQDCVQKCHPAPQP